MSSLLYAIHDAPTMPDFSRLYRSLGLQHLSFASMRKAIAALKKQPPDWVVAEFMYGYANNYAGVNISNLDVFLFSLQKYAPRAKVVVFVAKSERQYVDKLNAILPLHAILQYPFDETCLRQVFT